MVPPMIIRPNWDSKFMLRTRILMRFAPNRTEPKYGSRRRQTPHQRLGYRRHRPTFPAVFSDTRPQPHSLADTYTANDFPNSNRSCSLCIIFPICTIEIKWHAASPLPAEDSTFSLTAPAVPSVAEQSRRHDSSNATFLLRSLLR